MKDPETYYTSGNGTAQFNRFWDEAYLQTKLAYAIYTGNATLRKKQWKEWSQEKVAEFHDYAAESILVRQIDSFQSYLVELIARIFQERPEMVPSGTIDARIVFQVDDLRSIRDLVIENVATKYAYMNVADLDDEMTKKFLFSLFSGWFQKARVKRLVEIRNSIVHNRSLIGRAFIKRVGAKADRLNERVAVPDPFRMDDYLLSVAERIDRAAVAKFKLVEEDHG